MTCRDLLWLFKVRQTHDKKKQKKRELEKIYILIRAFLSENVFQDLNLLDKTLTTARVMEMVTADRPDPQNFSSFLYVKVDLHHLSHCPVHGAFFRIGFFHPLFRLRSTSILPLPQLSFLEFFEILLGCAQVKRLSSRELKERQTPSTPKAESIEDSSTLTDSRFPSVRASVFLTTRVNITPHHVASCADVTRYPVYHYF